MPTVVISDADYPDFLWEQEFFAQQGIELVTGYCKTPEELVSVAHDADAVLVNRCLITREVLAKLPRCRVIVRYGVGVDNVDIGAATEHGIVVCYVPDYCTHDVATHAMGLLLCCWRRIHFGDGGFKRGEWLRYTVTQPVRRTIGHTVGIFGFGRIGRRMAELLYPFGFRTIAYDPYVSEDEMLLRGTEKVEWEEFLGRSDAITLHAPLTHETRGIFNKDAFVKMKRGVFIINTARGGIVDEEALLWALEEGIVAAAGLDVFVNEPMPNPKLVSHPKVIATPHWAWYSEEALWELRRKAAEQAAQVLRGEKPSYPLNWDKVHQRT